MAELLRVMRGNYQSLRMLASIKNIVLCFHKHKFDPKDAIRQHKNLIITGIYQKCYSELSRILCKFFQNDLVLMVLTEEQYPPGGVESLSVYALFLLDRVE